GQRDRRRSVIAHRTQLHGFVEGEVRARGAEERFSAPFVRAGGQPKPPTGSRCLQPPKPQFGNGSSIRAPRRPSKPPARSSICPFRRGSSAHAPARREKQRGRAYGRRRAAAGSFLPRRPNADDPEIACRRLPEGLLELRPRIYFVYPSMKTKVQKWGNS